MFIISARAFRAMGHAADPVVIRCWCEGRSSRGSFQPTPRRPDATPPPLPLSPPSFAWSSLARRSLWPMLQDPIHSRGYVVLPLVRVLHEGAYLPHDLLILGRIGLHPLQITPASCLKTPSQLQDFFQSQMHHMESDAAAVCSRWANINFCGLCEYAPRRLPVVDLDGESTAAFA